MWRFLLLLGFFSSAHAADDPQEKAEAPKFSEPVPAVQVWDAVSGAFVSLSEAVRNAPGRPLVLDQVPTVRAQALQADGIKVIEQRERLLLQHRRSQLLEVENELLARYRGL